MKFIPDNARTDTIRTGTLTITDDTSATYGVITTANIVLPTYGTITLTGFLGQGRYPRLSLVGAEADGNLVFNGKVVPRDGVAYKITGNVDGWGTHSQGALGDDPAGAAATWSHAENHLGSTSALLTQDAAAGSTYVQFAAPEGITVSDLATISGEDWYLWHNLEIDTGWGPQVELRFTHPWNINPDGAGHVDITLLPYQQNGTGEWVQTTLTPATHCGYYGNDPWDATAFDEFSGATLVSEVEAAIDAEANMIADGPFSCSDWELTRVRVELWEAGARTCYIDSVTIDGEDFTFEPVYFYGTMKAYIAE